MSSMMVSLSKDEQLTDWMRAELRKKIKGRYRVIHFADDYNVSSYQLYRFMNGESVNMDFINSLFSLIYEGLDIHSHSKPGI